MSLNQALSFVFSDKDVAIISYSSQALSSFRLVIIHLMTLMTFEVSHFSIFSKKILILSTLFSGIINLISSFCAREQCPQQIQNNGCYYSLVYLSSCALHKQEENRNSGRENNKLHFQNIMGGLAETVSSEKKRLNVSSP
jgi:hypothetical protein